MTTWYDAGLRRFSDFEPALMRRLLILLTSICLGTVWVPEVRAESMRIELHDAGRVSNPAAIHIWANSPRALVRVQNPGPALLRTEIHWHNVLRDAYLVTPQGVADAPAHEGTVLTAEALVGSGASGEWTLSTNSRRDYAFSVSSGSPFPHRPSLPDFAYHLGDSGLPVETLLQHLDRLPYPTYVVPGDGDARKRFVGRTGSVGRHFEMGPDLHVVIDSQNRRISPRQLSWLRNLAGRARSKGTRRLFAIVHHPPTYGRGQIALRRADSDAMLSALSGGPPVTLFAARRPGIHSTPRGNVQIVSVGPGRSILVRVSDEGVTLQPEVKGP